jgi:hypothetical protein
MKTERRVAKKLRREVYAALREVIKLHTKFYTGNIRLDMAQT